jgi:hypothetical protein
MLRLVRRRALSMMLGLVLAIPAAWIELSVRNAAWWLEGLSVIVGATGLALLWTGLTGVKADWLDE